MERREGKSFALPVIKTQSIVSHYIDSYPDFLFSFLIIFIKHTAYKLIKSELWLLSVLKCFMLYSPAQLLYSITLKHFSWHYASFHTIICERTSAPLCFCKGWKQLSQQLVLNWLMHGIHCSGAIFSCYVL